MTDHSTPQDDADAADPTRQKLESLFKMLRGSDGPTPGDSNAVSQRFRLLRRHASGGLGDIWIAQDEELNREVALKEIQPQFAGHEQSWSRFLREATITGQLEHPGIVPIYALGRHENGQPFYAMRFVQGDTLADAIAKFHRRDDAAPPPTARNLQLRQLITRLIDVCNAVAYAHSRSIIHRDLKPANIMLGEFGETLVVDWGLAKSLAEVTDETKPPAANVAESLRDSDDPSCGATRLRETPPTQMGSAIGSPPYMSPEQAAGRLDELGPASDIYSLGATLFELLTGQSPIGAAPAGEPRETLSIKDLLQRIQEGRFPRPSTVTPDVPRALEAVCLKAMSLRPEDRYASARDLASDLEAWLADEPVTAWTEPLTIRARRWMRRHQTTVVSTAATALVAIVALSVLAFVVTDRNERLATAKGNLEHSNSELSASNQREREQTNLATQRANELDKANQQVKAEVENVKQAADVAIGVFKFFEEKFLAAARPVDQDGGLGVEVTIRAAVDSAEPQIAAAFQDQPLIEAAMRYTLGLTYSHLGEAELAIQQFQRSRQLRSDHLGADHFDTLSTMNNLALAYRDAGQFDKALPLLEESLEKTKEKLGTNNSDTLANMHNLALAYLDAGKLDQAIPLFEQTLEKQKGILGLDHPNTLTNMNMLARAYKTAGHLNLALPLLEETLEKRKAKLGLDHSSTLVTMSNLAEAYQATGQLDRALPLFEQTNEKTKEKFGPNHPKTLTTTNGLAGAYFAAGKVDVGIQLYEETLEKRKAKLSLDHPDTLTSFNNLALAYLATGQLDRALPLLEQTLEKRKEKLGADHPDTLGSMNNLANAYYAAGKLDQVIALLEQTVEKMKAKLGPAHPHTLISMNSLATAYKDAYRFDRAIPLYEETLKQRKATLGTDHPSVLVSMNDLALAYQDAGKLDQAIPLLEETLEKMKAKLGVDHLFTLTGLANLAMAYQNAGKLDEAEPLFRDSFIGFRDKLSFAHPTTQQVQQYLIECYGKLGQPKKAEPLWRELTAFWKDQSGTDSPEYAGPLASLSLNLLEQKKFTDAEPLIRECLTIREKKQPDHWTTFNTKSLLGGSLLGQKKYAAAEPPLLAGYEGMKQHEADIPAQGKVRLTEAIQRLVDLYDATEQKEKATEWRTKLPKPTDDSTK